MAERNDKLTTKKATGQIGRVATRILFENGTYDIEEFHDVFLQEEDLTEYRPAMKLVGDWREWERLKRDFPTFQKLIEEWKSELRIKLTSEALRKIQDLAKGDDPKALAAAKFIAEEGDQKAQRRGRPSKSEKEKAALEIAKAASETAEERERMLKVINGGRVE